MRAYGQENLPKKLYDSLDVADIQELGCASHVGRLPEKGGDFKPYSRTKARNETRRHWKRKARAAAKKIIQELSQE